VFLFTILLEGRFMVLAMAHVVTVTWAAVRAQAQVQEVVPVTVLRFFPLIAVQDIIAHGSVRQDVLLHKDIQGGGIFLTILDMTASAGMLVDVDNRAITPVDKNVLTAFLTTPTAT